MENLIGDGGVTVEEILCENVGVEEDGGFKELSVCPNVTISWLTAGSPRASESIRFCARSLVVQISPRLRKELHGPFTPGGAAVC